ncbi:2-oxoglutarate dehydrogenase complex component E1-like [Microplitis demolitor]|uniref:2-oxoglutarate dehydrogenase complex component E1-like n=1 Tax=Microplitis demolitor TaxID=69319 RepID=UPI0004CD311D|nr:2-oxoglutarate dehydrogenase complex component E1-like [Microplitis demolitor]
MSPKSLLRHPDAQSNLSEIETGTSFAAIYPDSSPTIIAPEAVKKVVICSGKVYYDLIAERRERKLDELIAIVRIEQICPFPYHLVAKEISRFPIAKIMWVQEEHQNQGAYYYVRDRIALALGLPIEEIRYGGRAPSAAPATGSKMIHQQEIQDFLNTAMSIE